jgi:hypothetical protein
MLPLLFAAVGFVADYGKNVLFLTQPKYRDLVRRKMDATHFNLCAATPHYVSGWCNKYTWKSQEDIEKCTDTRFFLPCQVERLVYETSKGAQLTFLWVTDSATGSSDRWNEDHYQTSFSMDTPWSRLETYGDFLSHWQALCGFVQESMQESAKFVTSQYANLSMAAKIEEAIGVESVLLLRVGGVSLADHYDEAKVQKRHYALSAIWAPEEFNFLSKTLYAHPDLKKQCLGVLSESEHFDKALPDCLRVFLDRMPMKPTIVVTISSFGQDSRVAELIPRSDKFQVLILGSTCASDPDPHHMHYGDPVNLDAVFQMASLIVHGCGVGTINQVICSGKPSIGVSSLCEQHCNGMALEKLRVSRHFNIKSLCSTKVDAKNFATCILEFFDDPSSLASPDRLKELQCAAQTERESALGAFLDRVNDVCSS